MFVFFVTSFCHSRQIMTLDGIDRFSIKPYIAPKCRWIPCWMVLRVAIMSIQLSSTFCPVNISVVPSLNKVSWMAKGETDTGDPG